MYVWECPFKGCPESFFGGVEEFVSADAQKHLKTHMEKK